MSNSILVNVNSAVHMVGVANKGRGNPYDFGEIRYNVPFTDLKTEFCIRSAVGNDVIAIPTSQEIINDIKSRGFKFPIDLELHISADPTNLQRNICTGFSVPESPKPVDPIANKPVDPIAKKFGA